MPLLLLSQRRQGYFCFLELRRFVIPLEFVGFIRELYVFARSLMQALLQETVIHRSFAYVSIITKNPQTFAAQGLSADGVKWTRTIDPHDVNVIL